MRTPMAETTAAVAATAVKLVWTSMARDCTAQRRVAIGMLLAEFMREAVQRHWVAGTAYLLALSKWTERDHVAGPIRKRSLDVSRRTTEPRHTELGCV